MAMRVQNVQQGFVGPNGVFHPIRASADYDPSRAGEVKKRAKAKKAKGRKAVKLVKSKKRVAGKRATTRKAPARVGGLRTKVRRANPDTERDYYNTRVKVRGVNGKVAIISDWVPAATQKAHAKEFFPIVPLTEHARLAELFWKQAHTGTNSKGEPYGPYYAHGKTASIARYHYNVTGKRDYKGWNDAMRKKYFPEPKQNPIPVGRFVNAKVRMLKGGLTQVLLEGKAVGRRLVKTAKRAVNPKTQYEVVVGNIGTVYSGGSFAAAKKASATYVAQSKTGKGRAGGEDVTILADGEIVREFLGSNSRDEGWF
jgi:hypothetical protein